MQYDRTEIIHLAISVVTITFAFWIVLFKRGLGILDPLNAGVGLPVVFFAVGVGFVAHELGHKLIAQKFGCVAAYRAWMPGLLLALGFAVLTPFIFAAPGAVYIRKRYLSMRENGLISITGPLVNFMIALVFLWVLYSIGPSGIVGLTALLGFKVNMFLGFFNMLPFPPLDGYKVLKWNSVAWVSLIAVLGYFNFIFAI